MSQVTKHHQTFEEIRQETAEGHDYWSARDLQNVLGYSRWDKCKPVILKAINACNTSGIDPSDHFPQVGKMVTIGSGAKRQILTSTDHFFNVEKMVTIGFDARHCIEKCDYHSRTPGFMVSCVAM